MVDPPGCTLRLIAKLEHGPKHGVVRTVLNSLSRQWFLGSCFKFERPLHRRQARRNDKRLLLRCFACKHLQNVHSFSVHQALKNLRLSREWEIGRDVGGMPPLLPPAQRSQTSMTGFDALAKFMLKAAGHPIGWFRVLG